MSHRHEAPPKGNVIFRRFRTDKRTGKTYDAWDYGLRGWPIRIRSSQR